MSVKLRVLTAEKMVVLPASGTPARATTGLLLPDVEFPFVLFEDPMNPTERFKI